MSPTLKAAFWMTGSIFSFSAMAVAGRELASSLDTFEIMMYRSIVGVLIVMMCATYFGTWNQIGRRHLGAHLLRNLAHFTGQNLWFFAVTLIPLAQVFALEFTSPIWVILLSPLILGEKLTRIRMAAAILGFLGILIVARPDVGGVNIGMIAAAISAFFFALTNILTRRLTRTESITAIMFYLTVLQLIMGVITAGYDGDIAMPDAHSLPFLVLIGIAGLLAHFCLTNALSIAPATVVMPIDFIRLPTIAIIGMLLYAESLDIWVFVGAAIIFGANYANLLVETRKPPA
ncbi:MAG: DMT family transporter [Paracoccaceae bacterium]